MKWYPASALVVFKVTEVAARMAMTVVIKRTLINSCECFLIKISHKLPM